MSNNKFDQIIISRVLKRSNGLNSTLEIVPQEMIETIATYFRVRFRNNFVDRLLIFFITFQVA